LAKRGHEVFFAGRDLSQATRAFDSERITLLPAPWKCRRTSTVEPVVTFADLLFNIGFGDPDSLTAHVIAWRNLYCLVNPDLLICDHSPTALLATIGERFPITTLGNGFLCPVDETPLQLLRTVSPEAIVAAREREEHLLRNINS